MAVMTLGVVAIALAATVMFVSHSLSDSKSGYTEPVAFTSDERSGQAVVAKDSSLDWSHVQVKASAPLRLALNAPADSLSTSLPADQLVRVTAVPRALAAASYIDFCADGPDPAMDVAVTLVYNDPTKSSQVLREMEFNFLAPCA